MELSAIIPTYNEKDNIEELINRINRECSRHNISTEVIVVDDNSPDGTADAVRKAMKKNKNVRLIVRKKKEGVGAAIFQGYNEAKGKIVGSIDADLSIDPKYIPQVYDKIKEGYDVVTGSVYIKGAKVIGKPKLKSFISRCANIFTAILLGMNLHDYTLNFRFFKRKALPKKNKIKDNVMLVESLYYAKLNGFKLGEIPITFIERKKGKSKMRLGRLMFYGFIELMKLRF